MTIMKVIPLALLLVATALHSCAPKSVLKQDVINKHQLEFSDLNNIQFYNSHDIVLTRYEPVTKAKNTEKGNLNLNLGQEVDQVIIKRGTKGRIVKDLGNGKYGVSFENDQEKILVFGRQSRFNVYHLEALEWQNGRGKVQYGDAFYFTQSGADQCSLLFKLKKSLDEKREVRVAKGNKVK
ncbi:MAG: hypothetical protein Salg2KO_11230 [Salibacteraceae bacterium]